MLKPRNISTSYTLLIAGGNLQGSGQCLGAFLLCRSSVLKFLPLPLAFSINVFRHTVIYIRAIFLGIKKQALDEIVILKFETSGNCMICSKFVTTNTKLSFA